MKIFVAVAALVILPLIHQPATAEGLLYRLPKDGTWTRFEYVYTVVGKDNPPRKGSFWMASVGQATVNGEACRWIELRQDEATFGGPLKNTYKVLVPEQHLGRGKSPLNHVVRGWFKGSGEPKVLNSKNNGGFIMIALASPLKDVAELKEEVIVSKLGELACPGIKTTGKFPVSKIDWEVTFETRLHPKAPFGVVTCDFRERGSSLAMKLIDFGDGAKSEMPEAQ